MEKKTEGEEGKLEKIVPVSNAAALMRFGEAETTDQKSKRWCKTLSNMADEMRREGFLSAADELELCTDRIVKLTS